jgi:hypothetical protein
MFFKYYKKNRLNKIFFIFLLFLKKVTLKYNIFYFDGKIT